MKKRLLALILCLVMVIGLVPTALAVDTAEENVTGLNLHFIADNNFGSNADGNNQEFWKLGETYNFQQGAYSKENDAIAPSEMIAPDGYHFYGWATERGNKNAIFKFGVAQYPQYPDDLLIAYTLTLYGIWEPDQTPNPDPVEKNTVTYMWDENSTTVKVCEVNAGEYHTVINYPTEWQLPEKKVFDHWTDGTKNWLPGMNYGAVVGNDVLYAVYKDASADLWTVTYDKAPNKTTATFQIADCQNVVLNLNGGRYVDANDAANNGKTDEFVLSITKDTTIGTAKAAGKTFIGWEKSWYQGGDVVQLTAQWKEDTATKYTVTFYCWNHDKKNETQKFARGTTIVIDPNGGEFKYDGSYISKKQSFNLTADYTIANAARRGYTFYGWEAVKTGLNTVTFTAQWSKDYPNYRDYSVYYYDYDDGKYEYAYFDYNDTLIFDANGGSAKLNTTKFTGTKTVNVAQNYTLSDAERAGYTFYGWDLTKSGSKYYFTAMWAKKSGVPYMLNGTDHYAYIKGYPNGTIRPEATITRAEVATIFYRLLTDTVRKSYGTSYNTFKDVASNAWYNTAVSTMANLGIITGDTNGYFRPNDSITRAELAAMIARCDGGYYTGTGYYFSDTKGHWAADYIARAYDLGWINGYGDSYAPDRKITRAETMAVLNRVLERNPQYTSDLLSGMNTFSDNQKTSAWYYLDVQEATNSHTYTRKTNGYEYWNKLIANPSWY